MKPNPEAQLAVKLFATQARGNGATGELYQTLQSDAIRDAAKLCSMARSLNRLHEIHCSRPTSDREENRIKELAKAILKLLVSYNLQGEINSDPRGYAVYIHFPNGSSNSWGGNEKGWGI